MEVAGPAQARPGGDARSGGPDGAARELAGTVRREGARILASLVRVVGLGVAEDAVQEAVEAALREWPRRGVPPEPRAWLTLTARRKAIDMLRREAARAGKEQDGAALRALAEPEPTEHAVRDDQLRLIFTCCHPALAPQVQVALALRTLCGLRVPQVAAVLLTSEPAMAKRLTRARQKIAGARIPYRVPGPAELPARLAAVCGVVHALYTAGHAPAGGPDAVDVDACTEAVRLARLLHELLPAQPLPTALLALLLLADARRPARVGAGGELITLAEQDRTRWDGAAIAEGLALLADSLRASAGIADPYQLQAAIAAEHARVPSYHATDWAEIVRLYDLLYGVAPSPAVALNRAVAVAEHAGPAAGLAALEALGGATGAGATGAGAAEAGAAAAGGVGGPRRHAVRAELLARSGDFPAAVESASAALAEYPGEEALPEPERRHLARRRTAWQARSG